MCGRFAKYLSSAERADQRLREWRETARDMPGHLVPRYNIAPSQEVLVIRRHPQTGELHEDALIWGLVPRWTRNLGTARRPINARGETVQKSAMFVDSFRHRRCLVAMDCFYEWAGAKPPKQPFAIARRDHGEMLVAGIWDGWRAADGSVLRSFAVITTTANATLAPIHHRMPVVIAARDIDPWLAGEPDAAAALLRPAPNDTLLAWPVSSAVNDVRRDGPELLQPKPGCAATA
jgi:putative SOS response-associated peptidase YedK